MKRILSIILFVVSTTALIQCSNTGTHECDCAAYLPPPCDPTYDNAYICGACQGYRWTCGAPKPNPSPAPKKGMIDGDGFNWKTGEKVK